MATRKPTKAKKSLGPRKGPEAHAEALRLLGEGYTITAIAKELRVSIDAIRDWRDHPNGQEYLAKVRKEREQRFAEAGEHAKRRLKEVASAAVEVLAEKLRSPLAFEAITAAQAILDRVGVVKGSEITVKSQVDLSSLTDEELALLDRIHEHSKQGDD